MAKHTRFSTQMWRFSYTYIMFTSNCVNEIKQPVFENHQLAGTSICNYVRLIMQTEPLNLNNYFCLTLTFVLNSLLVMGAV